MNFDKIKKIFVKLDIKEGLFDNVKEINAASNFRCTLLVKTTDQNARNQIVTEKSLN